MDILDELTEPVPLLAHQELMTLTVKYVKDVMAIVKLARKTQLSAFSAVMLTNS